MVRTWIASGRLSTGEIACRFGTESDYWTSALVEFFARFSLGFVWGFGLGGEQFFRLSFILQAQLKS